MFSWSNEDNKLQIGTCIALYDFSHYNVHDEYKNNYVTHIYDISMWFIE